MSRIAVIGAGAWGTALSIVLGRNGSHKVRLWAHEEEVQKVIAESRENAKFLPGYRIPDAVMATNDLRVALEAAEIVVSVMPSHHCRTLFSQVHGYLRPNMLLVSATNVPAGAATTGVTNTVKLDLIYDAGPAITIRKPDQPTYRGSATVQP